jgi:uncharacterized protein (TIGR03086 family)
VDILDVLETELRTNDELLANVSTADLARPTPCREFVVGQLVDHMIGANNGLVGMTRGETWQAQRPAPETADDSPAARHLASSVDLMQALRARHVLDEVFDFGAVQMRGDVVLRQMLLEVVVHGWDLAKATGQRRPIDPDLAMQLLDEAKAYDGARTPEGTPYGPAVEVPSSASPGDRLLAFLGRVP